MPIYCLASPEGIILAPYPEPVCPTTMNAFMLMCSSQPPRPHNNDVVRNGARGNPSLATEQTGATRMFKRAARMDKGRAHLKTFFAHIHICAFFSLFSEWFL